MAVGKLDKVRFDFTVKKVIEVMEEERRRVAMDIHDGPAQSMSNVVLKAEICEKLIDVDIARAKEELKQLKDIVRNNIQDIRKIIYNLRPMSLDDLGLVPTLQRYMISFREDTGIKVNFRNKGVFDKIKPVVSLAVFRIVQEAMNNINKHADARNVCVDLEFYNMELKIYIYDDGKGFDTEEIRSRTNEMDRGYGLFSIQERIELLGGDFELVSRPGKGTRLNISIPDVNL